jgi:hypothetical protein
VRTLWKSGGDGGGTQCRFHGRKDGGEQWSGVLCLTGVKLSNNIKNGVWFGPGLVGQG